MRSVSVMRAHMLGRRNAPEGLRHALIRLNCGTAAASGNLPFVESSLSFRFMGYVVFRGLVLLYIINSIT